MNDDLLLRALANHLDIISQWMLEEQQKAEDIIDNVSETDDPVKKLPRRLRRKLRNRKAFRKAYRDHLIKYVNGKWKSCFDKKIVFAYFCGRCFSEDFVEDGIVEKGEFPFPESELFEVFGLDNMRYSRKNLLNRKISKRCKGIDYLFDTTVL